MHLAPLPAAAQSLVTDFQVNGLLKKLIRYFTKNQRKLFLIDSLGALMTAFFLFVVMRNFNTHFGMPERELTYLAAIALSFCMYSAACSFLLKEKLRPFILFIGALNLSYCALTIGLMIIHHTLLTPIGTAYFLTEIVVILALSYVELSVATEIKNGSWDSRSSKPNGSY